jgi:hypothetical protein
MKLHGMKKPIRFALMSVLVFVFLLSACSTGSNTVDATVPNQPAEAANNTTGTQNSASTEKAAPTESAIETQLPTETPTEEQASEDTSAGEVSYSADVLPILESRCIQCHGGDKTEGELLMLTYDQLMAGGEDGVVVVPGDADNSLMAQLLIEQKMPKRGPKLTPAQTQIIVDWINQGALNN